MPLTDVEQAAPILTSLVATVGVFVAARQLYLNRKNQRETTAKTTFREFLKLCIQHPDLAYGKPGENEQEKYEWFVAHFLWAAEELLDYAPKEWDENLKLYLTYHGDFIRTNKRFREEDFRAYGHTLQQFIRDNVRGFVPP
jgi:hypothetical protein